MQFDRARMKITNVEVLVLKSPGLYNNPEGSEEPLGPTYMGITRVSTDAGITGYSDMETVAPVAKAAVDAPRWSEPGMECFDGLASLVIGENPLEVERLWYKMYRGSIYYGRRGVAIQAISAIDIALWDIMGKFYRQPVHVLLGGKWRDKVRAYASTLFRPTPEAMREATRKYLDEGFTAIKFGWGVFGKDPSLDVRLVEAARKEMGDRKDLLVDTGWFIERTPKQAIQVIRSIEPFRPFFVEEILHPEDYDGYRQVAESVDTLVACGEQEATEWGFHQLIERGKVDILQPDLTRCGGFTVARKIVHMAERANVLVIPHSWSSDLLTAASLHLNAFQRRAVFIEFNTSQGPLSRAMVRQPLKMGDGYVSVQDGHGLGVEVNEETLEKYRIA
jgi:L-rhamnonate dehydratase